MVKSEFVGQPSLIMDFSIIRVCIFQIGKSFLSFHINIRTLIKLLIMSNLPKSQSIIDLDSFSACEYFLKSKSYCNIDLPPYYNFQKVLDNTYDVYLRLSTAKGSQFSNFASYKEAKNLEDINHHIYANKGSDLSWRDFQVIHPLLYIHLVSTLTEPNNWEKITGRFKDFRSDSRIQCLSVPSQSLTNESDKAEQVNNWWKNIEQKSIELALEYNYLYDTDIADCYGSIYTHSIAWAIETKEVAKNDRKPHLLGNEVDSIISWMQEGQTNGIPQGSNLMNFIAEIILGYIDEQLSIKIGEAGITDYKILRYVDDYRIFVNNPIEGSTILKILSEKLLEMGMRLNSSKTRKSDDVISTAIKPDKLDWLTTSQFITNYQQLLLVIREHSKKHPNSGSLKKQLQIFYEKIDSKNIHPDSILTLVSIVTDICYKNSATYTVSFAIISKLLNFEVDKIKKNYIIDTVYKKFQQLPNTGFMQIWFKRMIKDSREDLHFNEKLCLYLQSPFSLWNNDWIKNPDLRKALEDNSIIDMDKFKSLDTVIQSNEFALFNYHSKN